MGRRAKQITEFDAETGEVYKEFVTFGTQNGEGWLIMYRKGLTDLSKNAPMSALKVFLNLSARQPFEGGIKVSKKAIADELEISRTVVWQGFKWLKENNYIKERKTDGQTEFLLNPNVTTCGRKRKEKIKLWNSVEVQSKTAEVKEDEV